jgi:serine protease Do
MDCEKYKIVVLILRAMLGEKISQAKKIISSAKVHIGFSYKSVYDGLLVKEVRENSSAFNAGLKKGDVVQEINGKIVRTHSDFDEAMYSLQPGETVALQVSVRGTERKGQALMEK